jgi:hypothetical protein
LAGEGLDALVGKEVSILTRRTISLTQGDLILTGVENRGGTVRPTVVQASDPYAGRVSLVFDQGPLALGKWTVVDAQGIETDVSLVAAQVDVSLDQNLFCFRDPRASSRTPTEHVGSNRAVLGATVS